MCIFFIDLLTIISCKQNFKTNKVMYEIITGQFLYSTHRSKCGFVCVVKSCKIAPFLTAYNNLLGVHVHKNNRISVVLHNYHVNCFLCLQQQCSSSNCVYTFVNGKYLMQVFLLNLRISQCKAGKFFRQQHSTICLYFN